MTSIDLWRFDAQFLDPSEKSGFMNAKFFSRSQPVEAISFQGGLYGLCVQQVMG